MASRIRRGARAGRGLPFLAGLAWITAAAVFAGDAADAPADPSADSAPPPAVAEASEADPRWAWAHDRAWTRLAPGVAPSLRDGWVAEQKGEYPLAAGHYFAVARRAGSEAAERSVALQRLAVCLNWMGDYYDSFRTLAVVRADHAASVDATELTGIELLLAARLRDEAIAPSEGSAEAERAEARRQCFAILDAVAARVPDGPAAADAWVGRGDAQAAFGRPDLAREAYQRVIDDFPGAEKAVIRANLGLAKIRTAEIESALAGAELDLDTLDLGADAARRLVAGLQAVADQLDGEASAIAAPDPETRAREAGFSPFPPPFAGLPVPGAISPPPAESDSADRGEDVPTALPAGPSAGADAEAATEAASEAASGPATGTGVERPSPDARTVEERWGWTRDLPWAVLEPPARPDIQRQTAYAYSFEKNRDYLHAARQYYVAARHFPEDARGAALALQRLGLCLFKMDAHYEAYKALERARLDYPGAVDAATFAEIEANIAERLLDSAASSVRVRARDRRRALAMFDDLAGRARDGAVGARAELGRARAHARLNEPDEARAAFERVLERFADRAEAVEAARRGLAALDEADFAAALRDPPAAATDATPPPADDEVAPLPPPPADDEVAPLPPPPADDEIAPLPAPDPDPVPAVDPADISASTPDPAPAGEEVAAVLSDPEAAVPAVEGEASSPEPAVAAPDPAVPAAEGRDGEAVEGNAPKAADGTAEGASARSAVPEAGTPLPADYVAAPLARSDGSPVPARIIEIGPSVVEPRATPRSDSSRRRGRVTEMTEEAAGVARPLAVPGSAEPVAVPALPDGLGIVMPTHDDAAGPTDDPAAAPAGAAAGASGLESPEAVEGGGESGPAPAPEPARRRRPRRR